jgi:hypothetical protein
MNYLEPSVAAYRIRGRMATRHQGRGCPARSPGPGAGLVRGPPWRTRASLGSKKGRATGALGSPEAGHRDTQGRRRRATGALRGCRRLREPATGTPVHQRRRRATRAAGITAPRATGLLTVLSLKTPGLPGYSPYSTSKTPNYRGAQSQDPRATGALSLKTPGLPGYTRVSIYSENLWVSGSLKIRERVSETQRSAKVSGSPADRQSLRVAAPRAALYHAQLPDI